MAFLTGGNSDPKQRRLCVITGAAGGIGSGFARKLAERNFDLRLVDRDGEKLETLRQGLMRRCHVEVESWVIDLFDPQQVLNLCERLKNLDQIEILINNAGFGMSDLFVNAEIERHMNMVDVHVRVPTMLAHAVLPVMIKQASGIIVNVSSMGAWSISEGNAQYGATKNYLVVLSQILNEELRDHGVYVQALCPGFVDTEFHHSDDMKNLDYQRIPKRLWIATEEVVNCSLNEIDRRRKVIVVPGRLCSMIGRLMRMPLVQPIVSKATRREKAKCTEPST